MKHLLALLAWGTLLTGTAGASSIITLESLRTETGPSTVKLGAPTPAEETATAAQEPSLEGVTTDVAAVGEAEKTAVRRHEPLPMVIRGGIVGDAFVRSVLGTSPDTADTTASVEDRNPSARGPSAPSVANSNMPAVPAPE